MDTYSAEFYSDMEISSVTSAKEIVPLLIDRFHPTSVADVGCGTGSFALEFIDKGLSDVVGYEGAWMKNVETLLSKDRYIFYDISEFMELERTFDMSICLEVAEHLDSSKARNLIRTLTTISSRVVFSAAIPNQGGNHHVNEQWPAYWAQLFEEQGFFLEWDPRLSIWENSRIAPCYRQNLLVFSKNSSSSMPVPSSLVHPEVWEQAMKYRKTPLWLTFAGLLPKSFLRFAKRTLLQVMRVARK